MKRKGSALELQSCTGNEKQEKDLEAVCGVESIIHSDIFHFSQKFLGLSDTAKVNVRRKIQPAFVLVVNRHVEQSHVCFRL